MFGIAELLLLLEIIAVNIVLVLVVVLIYKKLTKARGINRK